MQSNIQNKAHPDKDADQGTDSRADKRKRQAGIGENLCRYGDVGKSLKSDKRRHAGADQPPRHVSGFVRQAQTFKYDETEEHNDGYPADSSSPIIAKMKSVSPVVPSQFPSFTDAIVVLKSPFP